MEDNFRIDSHKLIFHVDRVNDWLKGENICPVYLEVALSGSCNHRCIFCALDYLKYKRVFLDGAALKSMIKQASLMGVKSVMYAGEGEPLLYPDISGAVKYTKQQGIDVAITSNGVLLREDISEKILSFLSWIRISLNAGKRKTYALVHRTRAEDFDTVLKNLASAVKIRNKNKLNTAIGVQLLLIPENVKEIFILAGLLKNIGVDYLTIKPYSQHPLSGSRVDPAFKCKDYAYLGKKLQEAADSDFKIFFRSDTIARLDKSKDYRQCLGLPFWAYVDATGDVYACSAFLGKKEFVYGNICKQNFKDIIKSKRRNDIIKNTGTKLNVNTCRQVCRLDKINSYLWELKNPGPHVNFI